MSASGTPALTRREWLLSERPASRMQARLGRAYVAWRRFSASIAAWMSGSTRARVDWVRSNMAVLLRLQAWSWPVVPPQVDAPSRRSGAAQANG